MSILDMLGQRWTLRIVREVSLGEHRFSRIADGTGVSRNILADRLRQLTHAGIVECRPYSEHPPRHEYHLTPAGLELARMIVELCTWDHRWNGAPGPEGAPSG
ncbi:winged helix-turn-helix transcriptional regulator [Streptomyces liangshanensis]|uniref:Helix-turn-helix transcriptional regulator n=1 Tax=Streptomyces liangshanensis TaxID=2717324 RepID=A0A6G9GUM7_9ACTN|nr:helix-turn-helix domain-containing protein [Streptomyces liangshanensis]QIQ01925.1 helix-turn-helix transcriptional regulator [Streptomyces liangshanensis]